jgi:deoxycytidylate deaminase
MVEIAKAMCPNNVEHRCSHIAFLVKKNKILNIGWNKNKTVPITTKHPYHDGMVGRHAEVDVIFKSQREDFKGYKIVVLRVSKETKKLMMSKPCTGCASVIKQFGIDEVFYSNKEGQIVCA